MNENVNVCITPKGDKPVLHFSQFDNERVFTVTVLADDGESAAVLTGLDIEFRLRKTDSHVVTIAPESVADNVITFKTTEQMCACCGQNIASVVLMKDDMNVSTLDILVDIQRDILSGGLTSESDIRNLTSQIEQIVPEVIGDDYYTKTEVDELIDDIPTFDPTNYYNKSDVNGLLADKADSDDVYSKTETDNLLSAKMDNIGYHGVVDDAAVISFTTDCNAPLAIIKGKIDPNPSGFSALNVTRCGKNFFKNTASSTTVNGVTFTVNDDGTITANGTATTNAVFRLSDAKFINDYEQGTFILNGCPTGGSGTTYAMDSVGTQGYEYGNGLLLIPLNNTDHNIRCIVYSGYTANNLTFKPMIRLATETNTSFEPYNGQTATVNFGQTVTIGGVFDLTNGKITLSDDTEISVTPVTISSIAGVNNTFLDTGNLTEIAYFEGVEDNLIKLIKAFQI